MALAQPSDPLHDAWMDLALSEARAALDTGDVPVGAVLIGPEGLVLARARNRREADHDPSAHAEILVLREAAQSQGAWQLPGTTLVVTLEPCVMCAGAILAARVSRVVFGCWDDKAGAAGSLYDVLRDRRLNHRAEVIAGVREIESASLLRRFFGRVDDPTVANPET